MQPLAQVTVLDAYHGDSNLVDWYQSDGSWRRVLIDTGPGTAGATGVTAAKIGSLIGTQRNLIGSQSVPRTLVTDALVVPKLAELQVTHRKLGISQSAHVNVHVINAASSGRRSHWQCFRSPYEPA